MIKKGLTVGRGSLESSAVVGPPRGHHRDVLGVEGRGRGRGGETRVWVSGVRVTRMGMSRGRRVSRCRCVGRHSRGRATRVSCQGGMVGVSVNSVLPRRRLIPF